MSVTGVTGVTEAIRAIQFLEATGHPEPVLLLHEPVPPADPFRRARHAGLLDRGVLPLAVQNLAEAEAIAPIARGRVALVLHLRTLGGARYGGTSGSPVPGQVDGYLAQLDRIVQLGGVIAWSPDRGAAGPPIVQAEPDRLRRGIAERAALLLADFPSMAAALAGELSIRAEQFAIVAHPAVTACDAPRSRDEARFDLGLFPDEFVGLRFGRIEPGHCIDELLDAWETARSQGDARHLVIAGSASADPDTDRLLVRIDTSAAVSAVTGLDAGVASLFQAADVAVVVDGAPFDSGSLLLPLSFGVPVVAPRTPAALATVDERVARLYEPGDLAGLVEALREAPSLVGPASAAAAAEIAGRHDPRQVSQTLATAIRAAIRGETGA